MAAQSFLVEGIVLQQRSHTEKTHLFHHHYYPPRFPSHHTCSFNFNKIRTKSFGFLPKLEIERNPIKIAAAKITKNALQSSITGLLSINNSALAASGGRTGGSSSSSGSSSTSSSSSVRAVNSDNAVNSTVSANFENAQFSPTPLPLWRSRREIRRHGRRLHEKFPFGGYYYSPAVFSPAVAAVPAPVATAVNFLRIYFGNPFLCIPTLVVMLVVLPMICEDGVSVIKLQIGLLGLGRSLQKDLNKIAETADTSTSKGLHYILTDTVLALLRYPEYCISAFLSTDVEMGKEGAEHIFYQLSFEERNKFDEETLVNVNNIKKQSSTTLTSSSGFSNEHIVVTILVTFEGQLRLPRINNSMDLKEVLQKLGCLPLYRIVAVEVLWTPQLEDDTLSEEELLEKYPLLQPLQ